MPSARQAEIADYAANHTLPETVEWLATQSIRTSLSTLSRFLAWYRLREELERNAMTVETLLADLRCQEPDITPERLQQLGQNFFGRMVLQLQDPRLWLQSQELELKKHRLQLDWQKHRDQIELAQSRDSTSVERRKIHGKHQQRNVGADRGRTEIDVKYFLPYQIAWITDRTPLRLMQKSRQVGISYADAYDSVRKVCSQHAKLDVWISSRDEAQARLYVEDCKKWARILQAAARDLGKVVLDTKGDASAYVLEFASGLRIHSLSSNPNALAGKRGHVKLDEFALHPDQQLLYRVAKPVTTWGGTLSIISTHRGANSVFNRLIRDVEENGNPMGWSLHTVPIQKAVEQGLVERINQKTGQDETRAQFLKRLEAECIDREQWHQEYCCIPADGSTAFIAFELITQCEQPGLQLQSISSLRAQLEQSLRSGRPPQADDPKAPATNQVREFYLGVDVARKNDLCVFDLGEKIGDVVWDSLRLELQDRSFSEIETELYELLRWPQVKRACMDATGMGLQLAERAQERFGWKVEPITFTAGMKEELAFGLRADLEDRRLRLVCDDRLRADLRAIRKEVTTSGHFRFGGESGDSHCDRFWAKALRQEAARRKIVATATVG